jgi:type IV pilus assembly protein PilE
MSMRFKPAGVAGFTLVELLVTMVVAATLISIAVPTYMAQIRKSRRTEARTAVLDLATREERYYSVNNSYAQSAFDLGYGTDTGQIQNLPVGAGYYQVTVTRFAAVPPAPASFTIVATAVGQQVKDTSCQTFKVDQTGAQTSLPVTNCWN